MRRFPHAGRIVQQPTSFYNDRRANDREALPVPTTVQLNLHETDGNRVIIAQILSISYSGMGVNSNQALCPGTKLSYAHPTRADKIVTARIAWCKPNESHGFEHGISNESFDDTTRVDHYTVLQVSTTAEPSTIDSAYDFLSQRYHSSSPATANPLIYNRLVEAYQVLSDPLKRTAYESERSLNKNGAAVAKGDRNRVTITRIRNEMLELLYWRRVESPYKPVITIHEFETILKLPKDQMEFNLWFLRDKGFIARNDNACFVITAEGVAAAEKLASEAGDAALAPPLPAHETVESQTEAQLEPVS